MLLPAKLCYRTTNDNVTLPVTVLIDSGADDSFMDLNFACQAGLQTVSLECPLVANALDGRHLAKVTQKTEPVELIISGNHREKLDQTVLQSLLTCPLFRLNIMIWERYSVNIALYHCLHTVHMTVRSIFCPEHLFLLVGSTISLDRSRRRWSATSMIL